MLITENMPIDDPLKLEGYVIVRQIAHNPLARVYLYQQVLLSKEVTVKIIEQSVSQFSGFGASLQKNLQSIATIENPLLLKVLRSGITEEGMTYIIQEYASGYSLKEQTAIQGIDPESALNVIITIASAIQIYHDMGFTHGAMTPSNIFISENGDLLLESLSISALLNASQRVSLLGLESLCYAPPEFTTGDPASAQGDIYSLAALYYEMISGVAPRGVISPLSQFSKIDTRINTVIQTALAQCPSQRQSSLGDFVMPLYQVATSTPLPSIPSTEAPVKHSKDIILSILIGEKLAQAVSFLR